jgi:lipopolysaccharide/colanic/teichoic acid biosynthesis glycosyltransferase
VSAELARRAARRGGDVPVTQLAEPARRSAGPGFGNDATKRALDIVISLAMIIALAPLLIPLWWAVRLTSQGPALFRQGRLGRGRQPFTVLKLRTMYTGNSDQIHREYVTNMLGARQPQAAGPSGLFKLDADPRITPLGAWLRRTSLDELPQLFNVLAGQMSLVGPRPVLPWEEELFSAADRQRFEVKPGITGLWQVSGRSKLSMQQALELDTEYIGRRSLALDLIILIRTVPALLRGGAT